MSTELDLSRVIEQAREGVKHDGRAPMPDRCSQIEAKQIHYEWCKFWADNGYDLARAVLVLAEMIKDFTALAEHIDGCPDDRTPDGTNSCDVQMICACHDCDEPNSASAQCWCRMIEHLAARRLGLADSEPKARENK